MSSERNPDFSVVIPAFGTQQYLERAIRSVTEGVPHDSDVSVEIVVADDGSPEPLVLPTLPNHPRCAIKLVRSDKNQGIVGGRNLGIDHTTGRYVTILDSDDHFVPNWLKVTQEAMKASPTDCKAVFLRSKTQYGEPADELTEGDVRLTVRDFIQDKYPGEYIPFFEGEFLRRIRYLDTGLKKSCGTLSYIRFLENTDFWISSSVVRVYYYERAGSITAGWTAPAKAEQSFRCQVMILETYGHLYRKHSYSNYLRLHSRAAVYGRLAGHDVSEFVKLWAKGLRPGNVVFSFGSVSSLTFSGPVLGRIVGFARKARLLKRFG